jgi:hypothetical protein
MNCKHIFFKKFRGSYVKTWTANIFLKVWGLICKNLWIVVMIFAKWKVFCKTTVARPFWVVRVADPTVGRGDRLCLGVQLFVGN